MSPRDLLTRLLEYIEEQAKDIDPRAFRLASAKGFLRRRADLAGLPGVEFDLSVEGDHVWLRAQRLQASKPPALDERAKGLIRVSDDPNGAKPSIDEAGLKARLAPASAGKTPEERAEIERRVRAELIERLTAMGIEPLGALERVPQLVERRQIKTPEESSQEHQMMQAAQPAPANASHATRR